jgi:hypothetical protein
LSTIFSAIFAVNFLLHFAQELGLQQVAKAVKLSKSEIKTLMQQ